MSRDNLLFQDIFDIKDIDPEGKRFDRVSRVRARSENYEMDLTLDYNTELYPLEIGEKFSLVLAASLALNGGSGGAGVEKRESWRERAPGDRDLSDEYEYVMYGKVYRFDEANTGSSSAPVGAGQKVAVFVSFGGLLMCLEGDFRHLQNITVGENIYLLMRK
ncbi:DNA-directed RNA polymerases I, II, and III subunit RPABC3 [Umbelopsis sp. WA50703]